MKYFDIKGTYFLLPMSFNKNKMFIHLSAQGICSCKYETKMQRMVENKLEEGTKDIELRNEKHPITKASKRKCTQRQHTSASSVRQIYI